MVNPGPRRGKVARVSLGSANKKGGAVNPPKRDFFDVVLSIAAVLLSGKQLPRYIAAGYRTAAVWVPWACRYFTWQDKQIRDAVCLAYRK
ncbi:hypothetical protein GMSM_01030 [Geomonas sp. Red276]